MIFGSVCSGIEAAGVAWKPLGWRAAFVSEIEPFAKSVLAHRWSGVPDLGDMLTIGPEHGPVDVLVGGTPCQSFSRAGNRAGMADPRGELARAFVRLASCLSARWLLWENGPEALSANGGRDFGALLRLLGECGFGFAYRVLDARYFGVAQRRRRVFLVGHTGGSWQRAAAVLFERACMRGDPAPRYAEGPSPAGGPTLCSGVGSLAPGRQEERGTFTTALTAHPGGRYDLDSENFVIDGGRLRRLTPVECERLQGFPDGYTAIPGFTDGARYRAIGNSMAVPVMRWIGQRIQAVDDAVAGGAPHAQSSSGT